jgi:hypothetical protein
MRKYKLMLSPDFGFEVSTGWLDNLRKGNLAAIYRVISFLSLVALAVGAALFPLISSTNIPVYNYVGYLLLLVSFLVAALLASMILVGSRRLVDPPMFMPALIFVFMVLCGLLFAPANPRNTFGPDYAKYLGGLWVMVLLALYYLITVFVNSKRKLALAKSALMVGLFVTVMLQVSKSGIGSELFTLSILSIPVLILFGIETRKLWVLIVSGVMALIAIIWGVRFTAGPEAWIALILGLVMTLLTWVAVKNWRVQFSPKNLGDDIRGLLERKTSVFAFLHNYTFPGLAIDILIFIVIVTVWMFVTRYQLASLFQAIIQDHVFAFRSMVDVKTLLIGSGVNNNFNLTMITGIIRYQGLLGLLAYTILSLSSFYIVLQSMADDVKQKISSHWSLPLAFIVFAVPIYGSIANPTTSLILVWWASVGLLAAKLIINRRDSIIYQVRQGLQIRNRKLDRFLPIIQIVLVVLVFAFWVYFATQLSAWTAKGLI